MSRSITDMRARTRLCLPVPTIQTLTAVLRYRLIRINAADAWNRASYEKCGDGSCEEALECNGKLQYHRTQQTASAGQSLGIMSLFCTAKIEWIVIWCWRPQEWAWKPSC